jgi:hypothetical protein
MTMGSGFWVPGEGGRTNVMNGNDKKIKWSKAGFVLQTKLRLLLSNFQETGYFPNDCSEDPNPISIEA